MTVETAAIMPVPTIAAAIPKIMMIALSVLFAAHSPMLKTEKLVNNPRLLPMTLFTA